MKMGAGEVDLIPLKIDSLTDPEAMPSHQQHQRCIALPIAAFTNSANELSKLCLSEIAPAITALHPASWY
jgi:hypothetical protein